VNLICDYVEIGDDRRAVTCSEAATWLAGNGAVLCEHHLAAARIAGWRGLQRINPTAPVPAFIRRENRRAGEATAAVHLDGPEGPEPYAEPGTPESALDYVRAQVGQGLAEYALILALIALVAIVALIFLGGQVSSMLSAVGASV
jgi:Flp pilus assembly pilin Flp